MRCRYNVLACVLLVVFADRGPFEPVILNIQENFDQKALGINSAAWDRERRADWHFVDLPLKGLFSQERAVEWAELISPDKALFDNPGSGRVQHELVVTDSPYQNGRGFII